MLASAAGRFSGGVRVWDAGTGKELHQFEPARWSELPQNGTLLDLWETDMARVFVGELRPKWSLGVANYSAQALSLRPVHGPW